MKIAEKLYTQGYESINKHLYYSSSPRQSVEHIIFYSFQVHQLPSYRDQHVSEKPEPDPACGAADSGQPMGGFRSRHFGKRWADTSKWKQIRPGPSSHSPYQVHKQSPGDLRLTSNTTCMNINCKCMHWVSIYLFVVFFSV